MPRRAPGTTILIAASGPSLTPEDCEEARRLADLTIAVNDSWRCAPFADVLYAADAPWWNLQDGAKHLGFKGEKWMPQQQGAVETAARWGLRLVALASKRHESFSFDAARLHHGWNGGFQAINLAVLFGARRILLLGFDCQAAPGGEPHWHGRHPAGLNQINHYDLWRTAFAAAAPGLSEAGIEVVNCSRRTALTCFPKRDLEEVMKTW